MPRNRRPRNRKMKPRKSKGKRKSLMGLGNQMAKIQETVEFTDMTADQVYNFTFNLSQFQRASALAPNFKWYKAAKVEWRIDALFNTYQEGVSGTVPYLYQVMNRTQSAQPLNIQDIQAQGAKPRKFVGQHKIMYRPNWCVIGALQTQPVAGAGSLVAATPIYANGLKATYDWITSPEGNPGQNKTASNPLAFYPINPTPGFAGVSQSVVNAPNQTVYNGHTVFIDQLVPLPAIPVGRVTCTVTWVFKDPNCSYLAPPTVDIQPKAAPVTAELTISKLKEMLNEEAQLT